MGFIESVRTGFRKYATFSGRASRSEFWWWTLFGFLSNLVLGFIPVVGIVWWLVLFIPNVAVTARRLHDTNRSGWWMLIYLIGFAFAVVADLTSNDLLGQVAVAAFVVSIAVMFVFFVSKGTNGPNSFGDDPLNPQPDADVFT